MHIRGVKQQGLMVIVLVITSIVIGGCSPHVNAAKEALRNILRDPDSLQMKSVTTRTWKVNDSESHVVVCGMFNAKNGFGGYGESERFAYDTRTKLLLTLDEPPPNPYPAKTDIDGTFKRLRYESTLKYINDMCGSS